MTTQRPVVEVVDGHVFVPQMTGTENVAACSGASRSSGGWRVPVDNVSGLVVVSYWARLFGWRVTGEAREVLMVGMEVGDRNELLHERDDDAGCVLPWIDPGSLKPQQRLTVGHVARNRRCWVTLDMGMGKTVGALAGVVAVGAWPAVVVCPVVAKDVWVEHFRDWAPEATVHTISGKTASTLPTADVYVLNYDVLEPWVDELVRVRPQAFVFDEIHALQGWGSQRQLAATRLTETVASSGWCGVSGPIVIGLTGTPFKGATIQAAGQLAALGRLNDFGGYRNFCSVFAPEQKMPRGTMHLSRNEEHLHRLLLRLGITLRKLKDTDRRTMFIDLAGDPSTMTEYRSAETDIVRFLVTKAAELAAELGLPVKHAAVRARMATVGREQMARINTLTSLAAKAKIPEANKWIQDFLNSNPESKLVVFAHQREIVTAIADQFDAPTITGDTPATQRKQLETEFQTDPDMRLLVCSIKAAGVALTLTAAADVLIVERPWDPDDEKQAIDRCDRIGQTKQVTAWIMRIPGTADEHRAGVLGRKTEKMNQLTDGITPDNPQTKMWAPQTELALTLAGL